MAQYAATINLSDLDGEDGFRIDGVAASDFSGAAVNTAGDVNGDGCADIIIGAYNVAGQVGASYVVFGKTTGFSPALALSSLTGTAGFRIDGETAGDASGNSAAAGDLNADGFDDLIVGAPGRGATYVVFGKAGAWTADTDLSALSGTDGFRLDGETAAGSSVSSAGDVNKDGIDDLIIGAYAADPGSRADAGSAYVVFGKVGPWSPTFDLATLSGADGFRIDGLAEGDGVGVSVASAGDVNNDGCDDVIVGAVGVDGNKGASYVVFGKDTAWSAGFDLATLNGANGFRLDGESASHRVGTDVDTAGDINGDGCDDIIVGATGVGGNTGASYVVFGRTSGAPATLALSGLTGANGFRISGLANGDDSGRSVGSAGDVNGDGFDDLIITSPLNDAGASDGGAAYVVFGKASGWSASLDLAALDGNTGFRLEGAEASDFAGISAAGAGDVNRDGFADIVIGALFSSAGGTNDSGSSYVVFGAAPGEAVTRVGSAIDQTIRGGAFGDSLSGLQGKDRLYGSAGADTLAGGKGKDLLLGSSDRDTASFAASATAVVVDLSITLYQDTGEGKDRLLGIESLIGSDYGDRLTGDVGRNQLDGGGGADTLTGGLGGDTLNGGAGNDTFVFTAVGESVSPRADQIGDLAAGDIIDLSAIDADTAAGGDQAFVLVAQFSGDAGEARIAYKAGIDTSYLLLDVDGDGLEDFRLVLDGDHRGFTGFIL